MNVSVIGRPSPSWRGGWVAASVLIAAGLTGCKTGTAGAKPSWWTFGANPQDKAAALAAAPTFGGNVEKPSASAKPYPTTTTPQGYVLNASVPPAGAQAIGDLPAAAAPVTYGVTPPPKIDPPVVATAPASGSSGGVASGGSLAAVTPQVGPYATLPSEPPTVAAGLPPLQPIATPSAVPLAASPSPAAQPPAPGGGSTETQRVADARGAVGWPGEPPAAVSGGSRYDGTAGSRYGAGSAIDAPLAAPATAAAVMPAALEPLPAAPPAAAAPLSPPSSMPASGFSPPPSGVTVPAAPSRRPDPVYRPGGTSSYRPSRAILASEPTTAEPGDVRTVGFEAPASPTP